MSTTYNPVCDARGVWWHPDADAAIGNVVMSLRARPARDRSSFTGYGREASSSRSFWRSSAGIVLAVCAAVASFLLLIADQTELPAAWPLLLLIICLGMHFIMHRGHGGGDG